MSAPTKIFRANNVNIRSYPGNAGAIGPVKNTSCSRSDTNPTTTTCISCSCEFIGLATGTVYGSTVYPNARCTFCAARTYCATCSCTVCTCTRTIPGGMWTVNEAYEAVTRDAWGDTTVNSSAATLNSLGCFSFTQVSNVTDYKGLYYITCTGGIAHFVSALCSWVTGDGNTGTCQQAISCANNLLGACTWCIPDADGIFEGQNKGTYTPGYSTGGFHNGPFVVGNRNRISQVGTYRCVAYNQAYGQWTRN